MAAVPCYPSSMSDADRTARADARRRRAVLRRTRLERREHDLTPIDGAAALSLVDALTRESWSESGKPLPTYSRTEVPIRFVPGRLT